MNRKVFTCDQNKLMIKSNKAAGGRNSGVTTEKALCIPPLPPWALEINGIQRKVPDAEQSAKANSYEQILNFVIFVIANLKAIKVCCN